MFYAPKKDKRFTAIAEVEDGGNVTFVPATEAPIHPLIGDLEFIPNK